MVPVRHPHLAHQPFSGGAEQDHVLLHASAAALGNKIVIISGPQNAGKSTLVAGLVREGWLYVTDETVALRPNDLGITSYPKALSLDPGSWEVLADLEPVTPRESRHLRKQWQVDPAAIRSGAADVPPSARPALLLFSRYREGCETRWTRLTPAQALTRAVPRLFARDRTPARDFAVLARLASQCPAYDLQVGDLRNAVQAVNELMHASGS